MVYRNPYFGKYVSQPFGKKMRADYLDLWTRLREGHPLPSRVRRKGLRRWFLARFSAEGDLLLPAQGLTDDDVKIIVFGLPAES